MIQTRTKVDALKDLGEKVTGATLPSEENETIVGMIDKIAENYSGDGGGYPFPQEPKVLTRAWLYEGEKISIDFGKMKDVLLSHDIDLSGLITSLSSTSGGDIYYAYEMESESAVGNLITYKEIENWTVEINIDGSSTSEPITTVGGISIEQLLSSLGTQTITMSTYDPRYVNFGKVKLIDIDGNENEVELTADEVATYLSFE